MELSHLRAILALKELASFARAGQQLHLSPPAVFGQIRQLEDELGEKLYERIGKRLQLTAAGELLTDHARTILREHDETVMALKELSGAKRGVLRLGCGPHGSITIVPHLLRAFLAAYPNTEIRLISGDDQTLLREVRGGAVDVLLMSIPAGDTDLEEEPLWHYEMVFVFPPGPRGEHPAAPRLEDLRDLPFILFKRTVVIDEAIRHVCANLGFEPRVVMENDQPNSIIELVELGLGASMLPYWSVSGEIKKGNLRMLRPEKRQVHAYGMITRKASYRPKAFLAFRSIARQWASWWPMAKDVTPVKQEAGKE